MTIEAYMRTVLANLINKEKLAELQYCENDKDCGYRSALRFLGIQQTDLTDDIANSVIYPDAKPTLKTKPVMPMQLGFAW